MKLNRTIIVNAGFAASLALAGLTGCAADKSTAQDFFPPDNDMRRTRQFANVQSTVGAREDLTLNAIHFDGPKLNSLGAQKLARLVTDDGAADVNVYVNVPKNEMAAARRDDVLVYLKTAGVSDTHIKMHEGINDALTSPAADGLSRMSKVESGDAAGGQPNAAERFGQAAADLAKETSAK